MTNKEFLLQMLQAETTDISNEHFPVETVKEVFEIINEYDWAVFCSQMGDYDHPNDRRKEQTIKYLLCSHCYNKTGLPLFAFGKKRRYEFRKPMMGFTKCRFCHERNNEYKCELNRFVDGVCHYAMQDTINPKFGEEPTYCDSYEEKEE